jgi:hypothetical protein
MNVDIWQRWTVGMVTTRGVVAQMLTSDMGQKRKCARSRGMSVRPSGADIVTLHAQVRFVPFTIFCTAVYSTLFDRPVDDGTAVLIRVQSPRYRQVRRSTLPRRSSIMDIDRDHIDDTVLALLFLGRHDGMRTWKSFDWAAMERLHTKGLILDPVGKAKSVVFTDEGLRQSEASFRKLFTVGREA